MFFQEYGLWFRHARPWLSSLCWHLCSHVKDVTWPQDPFCWFWTALFWATLDAYMSLIMPFLLWTNRFSSKMLSSGTIMLGNHHCERFIFQKPQENEWWGANKILGITSHGFSILLQCCSSRWYNWKIHSLSYHFRFCLGDVFTAQNPKLL